MRTPYPSFTLVLSQQAHPTSCSLSQSQSKTSRMLDLEDPLMRTIDTRYDDDLLSHEDANTLLVLEKAVSCKVNGGRWRRLSLTTLVVDLALVVKHKVERLRLLQKADELVGITS